MTGFSRLRCLLPALAALGLATGASLAVLAAPGSAFTVEDRGTAGLDGKVVMSPAAERIETVLPNGGEQIAPGSVIKRVVIIHNRSKATVAFDLDVSQVVGSSADLIVEVRHGVHEGAAAWVTLERTSFSLKPGQQGTIGVTIRIPRSVKPGSKPFAVTATQRTPQVQAQGAGIAPQFKQVGIFILELPGDAPVKGGLTTASITSAQKSLAAARDGKKSPTNARLYVGPGLTATHRLTLSTEYRNRGERLLTPAGSVVIKDIFGRVAGRFEIKQFTVYPGGASAGTVELKGLPSLGIFTARVELHSEAAGTQTTTLPRFVMLPKWFLVAAAAFLLYGMYRLVGWRLHRRREWQRYLDEGGADGDAAAASATTSAWDEDAPVDDPSAWELDEDVDATES